MNCVVCLGDCLIFAKCIIFCVHWLTSLIFSNFLISILPPGLLIWLEGKTLTNQQFQISVLPSPISRSAVQQISVLPLPIFERRSNILATILQPEIVARAHCYKYLGDLTPFIIIIIFSFNVQSDIQNVYK